MLHAVVAVIAYAVLMGSSKQITKNSNNKIKTLNLTLNFNIGQDQVNNSEQLADRIRNENDYEDKE